MSKVKSILRHKRKIIENVFRFFLFFLPLQYAIVGILGFYYSEPWPAFVLPAFQNVDATPMYVFVDKPVFSVYDSTGKLHEKITPAKLFGGIQNSQLQGFLRTHFDDSLQLAEMDSVSKKWLLRQIQKTDPSFNPHYFKVKWIRKFYNYSTSIEKIDSTHIINKFSVTLSNERK